MSQIVEVAVDSLCKYGEELCGDWAKVVSTAEDLIVALSDGLGSGVKANILATLTAEIATGMLEGGAAVDQVVETLAETLPECQVRHLAYATFSILRIHRARQAYLVEYDAPQMILVRKGKRLDFPATERTVSGRVIREASFALETGDTLVLVSDGYIHAGVGGLYRFGWGRNNLATAVERWVATQGDAHELAGALRRTCLKLSQNRPGDDATAVVMRVRPRRRATVLTGPPANSSRDAEVIQRLMATGGRRIICGGTTAQIAARELGRPLQVQWKPSNSAISGAAPSRVPPPARLEGVDLVTEGILTLSAAVDHLKLSSTAGAVPRATDAGGQLARLLLEADEVHFLAGDAVNPSQLADVVRGRPMRQIYLDDLIGQLQRLKKIVTVEHF